MSKILVPVKRVPDYETRVKVGADGRSIQTDGIKWILNPFDEIAVEEAIRLKESRSDVEEIVVVSIGPEAVSEQLRTALAMGADRAILVVTDKEVDSWSAHLILSAVFKREAYKLIIMGKQSIDSDANQTGQLLAAELGLGQATFISKLSVAADWTTADAVREVDGGLETVSVTLPAVFTTDLRLNEPRYPSLPGIVKAKKKPLDQLSVEELGVAVSNKVTIRSLTVPPKRSAGQKVATVEELVQKLADEAKVL